MNLGICVSVIIYADEKEEKSENELVSGEMGRPGPDKNGGLMGSKVGLQTSVRNRGLRTATNRSVPDFEIAGGVYDRGVMGI